jgi:hypothetical protein
MKKVRFLRQNIAAGDGAPNKKGAPNWCTPFKNIIGFKSLRVSSG